jgi:hypothetical protein
MKDAVQRGLSAFARLFGVAVAGFGAFVAATGSLEIGIPLFVFGAVFALRPHVVGRLLELVGDTLRLLGDLA